MGGGGTKSPPGLDRVYALHNEYICFQLFSETRISKTTRYEGSQKRSQSIFNQYQLEVKVHFKLQLTHKIWRLLVFLTKYYQTVPVKELGLEGVREVLLLCCIVTTNVLTFTSVLIYFTTSNTMHVLYIADGPSQSVS